MRKAHLPFERTFGPECTEYLPKDIIAQGYQNWVKKYNIVRLDPARQWNIRLTPGERTDEHQARKWRMESLYKRVDIEDPARYR
jgi:hypothetical protein